MSRTYTTVRYGQSTLSYRPLTATLGLVQNFASRMMVWEKRMVERQNLAEMDDRILRDMGIDRMAATQEAEKPFWKP